MLTYAYAKSKQSKEVAGMLRTGQKIGWTKSEIRKFEEFDGLECEMMFAADEMMGMCGNAVPVGSRFDKQITEMAEEVRRLKAN